MKTITLLFICFSLTSINSFANDECSATAHFEDSIYKSCTIIVNGNESHPDISKAECNNYCANPEDNASIYHEVNSPASSARYHNK